MVHVRSTWLGGGRSLDIIDMITGLTGLAGRNLVQPVARAVKWFARRKLVEQATTAPPEHEPVPEGMRFYVEKGGEVTWYKETDEPTRTLAPRTMPSTEDSITTSNLVKREPYGYVCNSENPPLDFETMQLCYMDIWNDGNRGLKCGAEALCSRPGVKVSSTLWQTRDQNFKLNCIELSEAMRTVVNICGGRGGKSSRLDSICLTVT